MKNTDHFVLEKQRNVTEELLKPAIDLQDSSPGAAVQVVFCEILQMGES